MPKARHAQIEFCSLRLKIGPNWKLGGFWWGGHYQNSIYDLDRPLEFQATIFSSGEGGAANAIHWPAPSSAWGQAALGGGTETRKLNPDTAR
jgi:hypothetical protein